MSGSAPSSSGGLITNINVSIGPFTFTLDQANALQTVIPFLTNLGSLTAGFATSSVKDLAPILGQIGQIAVAEGTKGGPFAPAFTQIGGLIETVDALLTGTLTASGDFTTFINQINAGITNSPLPGDLQSLGQDLGPYLEQLGSIAIKDGQTGGLIGELLTVGGSLAVQAGASLLNTYGTPTGGVPVVALGTSGTLTGLADFLTQAGSLTTIDQVTLLNDLTNVSQDLQVALLAGARYALQDSKTLTGLDQIILQDVGTILQLSGSLIGEANLEPVTAGSTGAFAGLFTQAGSLTTAVQSTLVNELNAFNDHFGQYLEIIGSIANADGLAFSNTWEGLVLPVVGGTIQQIGSYFNNVLGDGTAGLPGSIVSGNYGTIRNPTAYADFLTQVGSLTNAVAPILDRDIAALQGNGSAYIVAVESITEANEKGAGLLAGVGLTAIDTVFSIVDSAFGTTLSSGGTNQVEQIATLFSQAGSLTVTYATTLNNGFNKFESDFGEYLQQLGILAIRDAGTTGLAGLLLTNLGGALVVGGQQLVSVGGSPVTPFATPAFGGTGALAFTQQAESLTNAALPTLRADLVGFNNAFGPYLSQLGSLTAGTDAGFFSGLTGLTAAGLTLVGGILSGSSISIGDVATLGGGLGASTLISAAGTAIVSALPTLISDIGTIESDIGTYLIQLGSLAAVDATIGGSAGTVLSGFSDVVEALGGALIGVAASGGSGISANATGSLPTNGAPPAIASLTTFFTQASSLNTGFEPRFKADIARFEGDLSPLLTQIGSLAVNTGQTDIAGGDRTLTGTFLLGLGHLIESFGTSILPGTTTNGGASVNDFLGQLGSLVLPNTGTLATDASAYFFQLGSLANSEIALAGPAGGSLYAGLGSVFNTIGSFLSIACFGAGTRIMTDKGEVPVEDLQTGDRILTIDRGGRYERLVWLGRRTLNPRRHPRPATAQPIRILAGAFGAGRPARDVRVSPEHAVFFGGQLVPAGKLVNGQTIVQDDVDQVTYFHIELARHAVLIADGMTMESWLDTGNRAIFENAPVAALIPEFDRGPRRDWTPDACAPLVDQGAKLHHIRSRLSRIAETISRHAARDRHRRTS